jgi:UDP-N-acetylmuramate: L-alanyl-gamma-D-glutamyl-meso-diaminopimelate ligase
MRLYFLGICGTFMAGLAVIARELDHEVGGCDQGVYPPMSDQLREQGIHLDEGFQPKQLQAFKPDLVIVGNAMKRGNPVVEWVLNNGVAYISAPQWLAEHVCHQRWTLAVAGTHGKTTTASMLAWILESAGLAPGFLIGGIPKNFPTSARCGKGQHFVIEADEYDSAFFDKRPKFIHYRPRTAILNNCEFDHADIYDDLDAIKKQFHYLVRTVPGVGRVLVHDESNLDDVLAQGVWSPVEKFSLVAGDWQVIDMRSDGSAFTVLYQGKSVGKVSWDLLGAHNVENALAAIAAANDAGVQPGQACEALNAFAGVKRRLEYRGETNDIHVYDDFAHHPTAIAKTLNGFRAHVGVDARVLAVVELGSYSMRAGVHGGAILDALGDADQSYLYVADDVSFADASNNRSIKHFKETESLIHAIKQDSKPGDHILVMSNKGFDNIHEKLLESL